MLKEGYLKFPSLRKRGEGRFKMKKGFLIAIVLIILLLISSDVEASITDLFPGQEKAIVSVHIMDKYGRDIAKGTGVMVDKDGIVVANCSMVSRWLEDVEYDLVIRTGKDDSFSLYRLIACNPRIDIAVFKVEAENFESARLPANREIAEYIRRSINRYKKTIKELRYRDVEKKPMPIQEEEEKVTAVPPWSAEFLYLNGLAYARMEKYTEAIEEYKKALEVRPDLADIYIDLGIAYYKLKRYRESIDAYKQALRFIPGSKTIYNRIGTIHLILGEYPEAYDAFKHALSIDDKDPTIYLNLAIVDILNGDRDAAWQRYVILKELDRRLADILSELLY